MPAPLLFVGTVIDAPTRHELRVRPNHLVSVDSSGTITYVSALERDASEYSDTELLALGTTSKSTSSASGEVKRLTETQFIVPGMVDTHVHAPQYRFTGSATDLPLMQWLQTYTFPTEARFASVDFARTMYEKVVKRMLSNGTTTALYYATIHVEATKILADTCASLGQRAFVGKVSMDMNGPDNYVESDTEKAITDAEDVVKYILSMSSNTTRDEALVLPVVTPRFIPTCSKRMLEGLSQVASKYDVHVQTHASETPDMVKFVESLYPDSPNHRCTSILNSYGLLTKKTVLAHGVYLRDAEVDVLVGAGTSVASCPLSNILLSRGVLPVERFHRKGLKMGLGTDVAGGWDTGMLSAVRHAVVAARTEDFITTTNRTLGLDAPNTAEETGRSELHVTEKGPVVNHVYGFHMATVGGAKALGIENKVGTIDVGKHFDALLVETSSKDIGSQLEVFEDDNDNDVSLLFEKFINLGDDRNVAAVWVKGKQVKG